MADKVVLAVGHSARGIYERLQAHSVTLEAKPIAVGFRVEHPQSVINDIQYGPFSILVQKGKGIIPVADYRLATNVESGVRSCYSFCMCPGGQIVPTSVTEGELCINGMSFSQRQSPWANSALVVSVTPKDMADSLREEGIKDISESDPLIGVKWQKLMEKKAAQMGGGQLVCPVQRIPDFLEDRVVHSSEGNAKKIESSYRMGVKESPLHLLYPTFITNGLKEALVEFNQKLPGFISSEGILHGVETRTSAPIQISRDKSSLESISASGLLPCGEGAGYAGGIVSAAVDGMKVARAIVESDRNLRVVAESKEVSSLTTDVTSDRLPARRTRSLFQKLREKVTK